MQGFKVLTSGKMWGEELVVDADRQPGLGTTSLARCMTYVEVYSISRAVFFKVTNAFDEARRLVRRGAVVILIRQGVVRLVKDLRKRREGGDRRGFMDMILDAADKAHGQVAHVNAGVGEHGAGGLSLQLQDDISGTRARVDTMSNELQAIRSGLNRLLEKEGLPRVPTPALLAGGHR